MSEAAPQAADAQRPSPEEPAPSGIDLEARLTPSREGAEKEYADLGQNLRHYANMRFAQLTLFTAITAGLAKIALDDSGGASPGARAALYAAGTIVALAFWVMEERAADYWHHFRRRAMVLEKHLGYRQYSAKPLRRISATNATRSIFLLACLAWLISLTLLAAGRI